MEFFKIGSQKKERFAEKVCAKYNFISEKVSTAFHFVFHRSSVSIGRSVSCKNRNGKNPQKKHGKQFSIFIRCFVFHFGDKLAKL